jgi:hypothetical protein
MYRTRDLLLSKISYTEKNKWCMFSLICRIYFLKMNDRNVKQALFRVGASRRGQDVRKG